MTSQEFHIDLDLKLQKLNSNATKNIEPEEKDWLLNNEVYKFLDSRTRDLSDRKRLGFQADFKRLKDVRELVTHVDLNVEVINNEEGRAILPSFIYKEVSLNAIMLKNCEADKYKKIKIIKYSNFSLPKGKGFTVNIVTENNVTTIFNTADVPNSYTQEENYFYMLRAFEEAIRNSDYKENFYVNYYGDNYNKSSFFITGETNFLRVTINQFVSSVSADISNPISSLIVNFPAKIKYVSNYIIEDVFSSIRTQDITIKRNMRILNEEYFNEIRQSNFSKSTPESPISAISEGFIRVINPSNIIIKSLEFTYLKKPSIINLSLNSSLELSNSICKEIVDNTVDTIKDLINTNGYKEYMSKNKIIE